MEGLAQREMIIDDSTRKQLVNRNIVLLLLGRMVSLFGSSIYSFAIGLYVLGTTGSALGFAFTFFLSVTPRFLLSPISGVVADRFDRKKLVVLLDIISGIIVLGFLLLSFVDSVKIVYIYGTTLLLNVCNTFFDTAITAGTPAMVDDNSLTKINSLQQTITSTAFILGPIIGGVVVGLIDFKLFLLINGLSFIASGISEMFIDFKARDKIYGAKEKKEEEKPSFKEDLIEGFRYLVNTKWLLALGIAVAVINMFVVIGIQIAAPVITKNVWAFSDIQYGVMMGSFPAGMIVASIIMSLLPEKEKNYRRIINGFFTFSIGILFFGIFASGIFGVTSNSIRLVVLIGMFIVLSFASVFLNIPVMVAIQKSVPEEMLGRAMGALNTMAIAAMPIGALIGGASMEIMPPWIPVTISGVILIIISSITARNKDIKKM